MQTSWSNDAECLCCGDGGMLLLCDFCPASYHLECAGIEQVLLIFLPPLYKCCAITFPAQVPARKWMCPHHTCVGCGKNAHECSNCLFRLLFHDFFAQRFHYFHACRCENCPLSFCQDCKPDSMSLLPASECRFARQVMPLSSVTLS